MISPVAGHWHGCSWSSPEFFSGTIEIIIWPCWLVSLHFIWLKRCQRLSAMFFFCTVLFGIFLYNSGCLGLSVIVSGECFEFVEIILCQCPHSANVD